MADCSAVLIKANPPTDDALTPYDRAHFVTYLKLLDAHAKSIDWKETARTVPFLDPGANLDGAPTTLRWSYLAARHQRLRLRARIVPE
jgi:hypothetical protein